MENKFDTYQIRCSAIGKIVSKSGKVTETIKSYIKELFISELYNTRKVITSKYFEKGLFEEETGISLLNETLYKGKLLTKNKERKRNEFIHGECDLIKDGIVYDIKNAWDLFTFGNADCSHDYTWQLRGYMWLWNVDMGRLFYCLNNTPEHLLGDEERKMFYANKYTSFESPDYIADCEELRRKHNYNHLDLCERFKIWDVECTPDHIEEIKQAVQLARNYMSQLWDEHCERILKNKSLLSAPTASLTSPIPERMLIENI